MRTLLIIITATAGCGLGIIDNPSGGDDNLPSLGAGPFGRPPISFDTPADEPYVVSAQNAHLSEPSVLDRADNGFRLWFSRRDVDEDVSEIWMAEIPGVLELPDVSPRAALAADQDWEQGTVSAPSVASLADGTLIMLYEGGVDTVAVGFAQSTDDGTTWVKSGDNPVLANANRPAVADTGRGLFAAFTRPGEEDKIYCAASGDGADWTDCAAPVLAARPGELEAFDHKAVASPSLVIRETTAGRTIYGIHFSGTGVEDDIAVGYAGSFDGVIWERFSGNEAVTNTTTPHENGPTVTVRGPKAYLFFSQERQTRQAIAVAIHP